jgi:site-specific DNA recombinase
MTLRTGTSRSGHVHRYYACSTHARAGKSACPGRSIRMDKLDTLVTDQLVERLLAPQRLKEMLGGLIERREARSAEVDARNRALRAKANDAEEA